MIKNTYNDELSPWQIPQQHNNILFSATSYQFIKKSGTSNQAKTTAIWRSTVGGGKIGGGKGRNGVRDGVGWGRVGKEGLGVNLSMLSVAGENRKKKDTKMKSAYILNFCKKVPATPHPRPTHTHINSNTSTHSHNRSQSTTIDTSSRLTTIPSTNRNNYTSPKFRMQTLPLPGQQIPAIYQVSQLRCSKVRAYSVFI